MSVLDWIAKWADYAPQKIAVADLESGAEFSYRELHLRANEMVHLLKEEYKEGDRVAVLLEHSIDLIALFSACQRLGLILVPLNYKLSTPEIFQQLKDCEPSLVIYSEFFSSPISLIKDSFETITLADFNHQVSKFIGQELILLNEIKEELPVFLFYTSGTTAEPKGVLYTNKMLFWNSLNTTMQLGISNQDTTLSILPPYHTSGWNIFVTPLLHNGGKILMLSKFDPDKILYFLQQHKVTLMMALPTILQMISICEGFSKADFPHLRFIISGGESISKEIIELWRNEKLVDIRPGYGLTEAGPRITSLHQDFSISKPNSIGKPNFYVDLDIVDPKGNSLKCNQLGELRIKGEIVTPGYWNNSIATADKIKNSWFHTGDLAYRDEDGFYYLKGRIDDMYICGGENIFPQEIENVLNQHPAILRSLVIPMKDNVWGKKGIAFLETKQEITNEDILEFLKDKLARFKHPKEFLFFKDFPLTGFGKISRKDLKRMYQHQKQKSNY